MSRLMEIVLRTKEEQVGGILADLQGRATVTGVGTVEEVPFTKNKPPNGRKQRRKNKKGKKAKVGKKQRKTSPALLAEARKSVLAGLHDKPMPYQLLRNLRTHVPRGAFRGMIANMVRQGTIIKRANGDFVLLNKGGV